MTSLETNANGGSNGNLNKNHDKLDLERVDKVLQKVSTFYPIGH